MLLSAASHVRAQSLKARGGELEGGRMRWTKLNAAFISAPMASLSAHHNQPILRR